MSRGIKPIDGESVHRIHSGQVVLDLQGALKELVENALDAGATSVEVRIRDNGLSSIEVSDNGFGIAQPDWASIGLKHHTSKLPSLELLPSVNTFGFRGEALSSLCALCESVTVTTATKEMEPLGAVIKLGKDGRVVDDTARVARPRGTTIALSGLFAPLPVRRKEFERNAKRELSKALTLLTAYALVPASTSSTSPTDNRPGVRIKVESIAGGTNGKGGKRNTLLSNDGRGDLKAGVVGVWGSKAMEGVQMMDLAFDVPLDRMAQRVGAGQGSTQVPPDTNQSGQRAEDGDAVDTATATQTATLQVKVTGLVSSASWGMGRSSADRQYFYINGRPVDAKPLQKALNEVYKGFNTHQVPLAVLDFQIPKDSIDINVSPDKRTILLHSETNLIGAFRTALEAFFEPSRSSFAMNGATQTVRGLKMTQSTLSMGNDVVKGDERRVKDAEAVNGVAEKDSAGPTGEAPTIEPPPVRKQVSERPSTSAAVSPFDLTSTTSRRSEADQAEEDAASEVGSEEELARFDASPITRRPVQLLEARRSRPSRRASNDPITVLDEEEEDEDGPVSQDHPTAPFEAHELRVSATVASQIAARPARRDALDTATVISTTAASWSPARKATNSHSAGSRAPSASSTPSGAEKPSQAKTGREARKSLRERLAVYSQTPIQAVDVRDDPEDADAAGAGVAQVEEDAEVEVVSEGEGVEGEDELESDMEETQMNGSSPGGARRRERLDTRPMKRSLVQASPERDEHDDGAERSRMALDEESEDDAQGIVGDKGIVPDEEIGQEDDEEREKVRQEVDTVDPVLQSESVAFGTDSSSIAPRRFRDEIIASSTGSMTIPFSLPSLQARAAKRRRLLSHSRADARHGHDSTRPDFNSRLAQASVSAEAGITNRDLTSAEAALSRTVTKDDFKRMVVVGQFNKGFVIARSRSDAESEAVNGGGAGESNRAGARRNDDLYIVDQHASDEKYNFETLQRETRIKAQRLINLQLTAADEIVAMENLETLKANGFEVKIDENQPPGRGERVKLVAMPVSKETVFDYRDLEQLLHLLSDSSHSTTSNGHGQMVRCTKARAMFAMRACRKSIMIGKSLTKPQMTQLLRNMGTIEQPWNCPHGRPTMRHLTAIDGEALTAGRRDINWQQWASERDDE